MARTDFGPQSKKTHVDIELTNACNATCTFCPRDNMPEIGQMRPDTFSKAIERAIEYTADPIFTFCGTGDALLHKRLTQYVRQISEAGCESRMSTNGYLMSASKAVALLNAGINRVTFSVSSRGERYTKEYGLNYETTHENILRFVELAKGRCEVRLAMVCHDENTPYLEDEAYWRSIGISRIKKYNLNSRGGALFRLKQRSSKEVHEAKKELASLGKFDQCLAPFYLLFIGWDGKYYLCSSDWRKNVPVGDVFSHSIEDTLLARRQAVSTRSPICKNCSHDPVNAHLQSKGAQTSIALANVPA